MKLKGTQKRIQSLSNRFNYCCLFFDVHKNVIAIMSDYKKISYWSKTMYGHVKFIFHTYIRFLYIIYNIIKMYVCMKSIPYTIHLTPYIHT